MTPAHVVEDSSLAAGSLVGFYNGAIPQRPDEELILVASRSEPSVVGAEGKALNCTPDKSIS